MQPHGIRVLVTGGSRGIGLAYAEALAAAGCNLVLNHYGDGEKSSIEESRLRREFGVEAHSIDADLGEPDEARRLVVASAKKLGGLDIVISNAGICRFASFLEIDQESWNRHVAVNFSAGFHVGQAAAQLMIAQGTGGRIVYTSSIGAFRSNGTQTHYCATKGGINLLAQGMAIELARYRITVNCIAPGWIHTDINDAVSRDASVVEPWLRANCPVGRLGKPADLKSAVLFLCSRDSAFVTGATVNVDGGWNAQL